MISCCNRHFLGGYFHVLNNSKDFYRKIELGICPNCGTYRFLDLRIIMGKTYKKELSGVKAYRAYTKTIEKVAIQQQGNKSAQNYYYGDFKKTREKDKNGNPIYIQLRKNFNNDFEILNKIETRVTKI